jgi:hypothetical protein
MFHVGDNTPTDPCSMRCVPDHVHARPPGAKPYIKLIAPHLYHTSPYSPTDQLHIMMMMRTLKLAVVSHLLLWSLCRGAPKGVSGERNICCV